MGKPEPMPVDELSECPERIYEMGFSLLSHKWLAYRWSLVEDGRRGRSSL
jgi:hypothetical protein